MTDLCVMTVEAFRGVLSWDGACVYRVDGLGRPFDHHLFHMPKQQLALYRKHFAANDPLSPSRFSDSAVSVVPLEIAELNFDARSYVDRFLNAFDLPHEVEIFFRNDQSQIVAGMGLFRSHSSGRFRASELDLLRRVRPVAECAFRLLTMPSHQDSWTPHSSFGLTRRETEIIDLVRRGYSNREIADDLSISIATVKTHLFHAFEKIGVSSRTELLSRLYLHS